MGPVCSGTSGLICQILSFQLARTLYFVRLKLYSVLQEGPEAESAAGGDTKKAVKVERKEPSEPDTSGAAAAAADPMQISPGVFEVSGAGSLTYNGVTVTPNEGSLSFSFMATRGTNIALKEEPPTVSEAGDDLE